MCTGVPRVGHRLATNRRKVRHLGDIRARDEGAVTGPCDYDATDVDVIAQSAQDLRHRRDRLSIECIEHGRAIHRHRGHRAGPLAEHQLVTNIYP